MRDEASGLSEQGEVDEVDQDAAVRRALEAMLMVALEPVQVRSEGS